MMQITRSYIGGQGAAIPYAWSAVGLASVSGGSAYLRTDAPSARSASARSSGRNTGSLHMTERSAAW